MSPTPRPEVSPFQKSSSNSCAHANFAAASLPAPPAISTLPNTSLKWMTAACCSDSYLAEGEKRDLIATHFEKNVADAQARGFTVPEVFLKFMRSRELRRSIPSCTACYFDAPEHLVEIAGGA